MRTPPPHFATRNPPRWERQHFEFPLPQRPPMPPRFNYYPADPSAFWSSRPPFVSTPDFFWSQPSPAPPSLRGFSPLSPPPPPPPGFLYPPNLPTSFFPHTVEAISHGVNREAAEAKRIKKRGTKRAPINDLISSKPKKCSPKPAESSKSIRKNGRGRPRGSGWRQKFAKLALIRSPVKSPSHSCTPKDHGKSIVIEHSEMPSEVPVGVLLQMAKLKKKRSAQKKNLLSHEKDISAAKPLENLQEEETQVNDHLSQPRVADHVHPTLEMSVEGYASQAVQQSDVENSNRPLLDNDLVKERATREGAIQRCSVVDTSAAGVSISSTARTCSSPTKSESTGQIDDLVSDNEQSVAQPDDEALGAIACIAPSTEQIPGVHKIITPLHSCEVPNEIMAPEFGQEGESTTIPNPQDNQIGISSLINWAEGFDDISNTDNLRVGVGYYTVEASLSPILKAINKKYGDIAKDCPWQSIRSFLLEGICKVLQGLKIPLQHLTPQDLKTYYSTVKEAQALGLNVKWLLERLEKILEIIDCIKRCRGSEDAKKKHTELLESTKKAFEVRNAEKEKLEYEIQNMEDQLKSVTSEVMKTKDTIKKIEERCKKYRNKCLMDDLF